MGLLGVVWAAAAGAVAAKPAAAATKVAEPAFNWANIPWAQYALNWGLALLIVVVGMWLAKQLSQWLHRALTRARIEITLTNFLRNVLYALLLVLVFVSALSKIGVPP
ncbi:mechanosensitive ion channel family protein, partial [Xanthomonas hortorum]|nr:mechanosensitive ion channel family protein [Xanthomonas hortorum pv. vitians]